MSFILKVLIKQGNLERALSKLFIIKQLFLFLFSGFVLMLSVSAFLFTIILLYW
jgi:hypothetical protein